VLFVIDRLRTLISLNVFIRNIKYKKNRFSGSSSSPRTHDRSSSPARCYTVGDNLPPVIIKYNMRARARSTIIAVNENSYGRTKQRLDYRNGKMLGFFIFFFHSDKKRQRYYIVSDGFSRYTFDKLSRVVAIGKSYLDAAFGFVPVSSSGNDFTLYNYYCAVRTNETVYGRVK